MADPRSAVQFNEIAPVFATFKIDNSTIVYSATAVNGSVSVGLSVTLSASDTVALASDGNAIVGKLVSVTKDNFATVQIGGGMTLPGGVSAALTLGKKVVGALGASSAKGYIRETNTGTAAENGLSRGFIINASDTANVVVWL